ncbi:unnamed protein product, partial [Hapterophycus canaliculatus]
GTLALSPLATRIAWGDLDARTGREWAPPLEDVQANITPRSSRLRGRSGRNPAGSTQSSTLPGSTPFPEPGPNLQTRTPATHDTNNFASDGFNRLPAAGERYSDWTVPQLREFLSVFRCLDNAGTSGFNEAVLTKLSADIVSLIRKSGHLGQNLAFRHPVPDLRSFEENDKALMPELPAERLRI